MANSKVLKNILGCITIISSVCLIGSVLAAYLDPQTFIIPAFLGLAFPFLLVIHLVLSLLYLIVVRSKAALLFFIPLLASANTLISFFGVNFLPANTDKPKSPFRFMTYNVHNFRHWETGDTSVTKEMFKLIENENPDIVCFQDFFSSPRKNNTVEILKKVVNTQYYYKGPDHKDLFPKNALAIFSKFPIINTGYIFLSDKGSGNQCIFVDVRKEDKIFRVYNVHLQSLKFQPEDFERWDKGAAHKISFISDNVKRLQYAFLERSNQVKIMKKELASCNLPYIVAGDFNDSPASYAVNEMSRGMKNTFREKAKGYRVTYDGDMPNFQIDYILTQPAFTVNNYSVIEKKLSDHFPVKVDLSL